MEGGRGGGQKRWGRDGGRKRWGRDGGRKRWGRDGGRGGGRKEVKPQTLCGGVTFRYFISSGTRSCVSSLPALLGDYWRLLEFTRVYWRLLEFTRVYRKLLEIHPYFYFMQCWLTQES